MLISLCIFRRQPDAHASVGGRGSERGKGKTRLQHSISDTSFRQNQLALIQHFSPCHTQHTPVRMACMSGAGVIVRIDASAASSCAREGRGASPPLRPSSASISVSSLAFSPCVTCLRASSHRQSGLSKIKTRRSDSTRVNVCVLCFVCWPCRF